MAFIIVSHAETALKVKAFTSSINALQYKTPSVMYLMDITALITQIHSAAMLKNTVFVYQDKKQKHQGQRLQIQYVWTALMDFILHQV